MCQTGQNRSSWPAACLSNLVFDPNMCSVQFSVYTLFYVLFVIIVQLLLCVYSLSEGLNSV